MSQKDTKTAGAGTGTGGTLVKGPNDPTITPTGELKSAVEQPQPAIKNEQEQKEYNATVRLIQGMQVEDVMAFQKEHGYVPTPGDTTVPKRGLSAQDQEDIIAGRKKLQELGPNSGQYRAEDLAPTKKK
jgi:hypothetical protein